MSADPTSAESVEEVAEEATDRRLQIELGTGAAVAAVFLVLRMLAVAHWDWHTVAAIADTFDLSDVEIGHM
ncbi:hypothetical protein [Gordonia humi]|uniref:Uncharacterized protein n=1 Tax=Gordonia humi TaxID=686429 RepID=A0A840F987_9ACTN|nr:hypothetical protein [Gordonia humi]MBB4136087.1 hypothetical protein [Gordonia humi]